MFWPRQRSWAVECTTSTGKGPSRDFLEGAASTSVESNSREMSEDQKPVKPEDGSADHINLKVKGQVSFCFLR